MRAPATSQRSGRRPRRAALVAAVALAAGTSLGLVAEVLWVSRRQLPVLAQLDASGVVPGRRPDATPLRLVVLGDSTLTGPGLAHPDEIWLRQALWHLQLERPVEVVSLAVGGSRVADVLRRVDDAVAADADLAVLAVGSNDAVHGTPVATFARTLDEVVERLLADVPVVAVSNVGDLGNIARIPPPLHHALRRRSRAICRRIEQVVERHPRAVLLDVTTTDAHFRDRTVFGANLFHPNPTGHAIWASAAAEGLRRAVQTVDAGR